MEKDSMNLYFLGGAMEIGGSCIYVKIAEKRILLDCGIRQSATKDPIPDFQTIQRQGGLDAIVISHAHMDHIGTLPMISKAYPNARIYMTAMTLDLTRTLLYDSLKIMNEREDEIPHYSKQDVLAMLDRVFPVHYQSPFPIFENFTLTFYPAGHIAGAACVYLVTKDGSLFYSGDFSAFSQRTIEGIRIPKLRPDVSIVETTYGNRLHANRLAEEKRLVELVKACVLEKKKVLIPAFALGRAQEVLLILRAAMQNGEISSVPVYVDGMVRDINRMYERNPTFLKNALAKRVLKGNEPFYTKEIQPVLPTQKRDDLLSGDGPVILVSSSGMLTGGPSMQYAAKLAPMENACIIITGYQDEESPGRQLLNLLESQLKNTDAGTLTVNGVTVPVKCQIEQVGLSAHGDKSEIMALLERLSSRHVFLVHGNADVIPQLGEELAKEDYRRKIYLPECGQDYGVSLRKARKQLSFQPEFTMHMRRAYEKEDEKLLWDFWQMHYAGKAFSAPQIAFIWRGSQAGPHEAENMQKLLCESVYFSPNMHRLFLLEANTKERVEEELAPKELTIQDAQAQAAEIFAGYSYRKVSCYREKKEIQLQFDYPDAQDREDFQKRAECFLAATGWTVRIHPSINHSAAGLLLSVLFGERLKKASYYAAKKCYGVSLKGVSHSENDEGEREKEQKEADLKAVRKFQQTTGLRLLINETASADAAASALNIEEAGLPDGFFKPQNKDVCPIEQNTAFFCIEEAFQGLEHTPDKKSLKQDLNGKYIELSFISPAVGMRYGKILQQLADKLGWRIRVADKVNQNALFQTAQRLCIKHGVALAKNPSYLPDRRLIQLKAAKEENQEKQREVQQAFEKASGCKCIFI